MDNKRYKEMERIIIDKENVDFIEEDIIIRRGIERYMYVRQFAYGDVLDIACGVGYGSYLMSKNPDVKSIISVDKSKKSIEIAETNFRNSKIEFVQGSPETVQGTYDILICLETVEHLENPQILRDLADRCKIKEIVISFPNKKTTHYNEHHLWDMTRESISKLLNNYVCYREKVMDDSTILNFLIAERDNVSPKKYYSVLQ